MADQFDYRLLARGVDPIKLDNPLDNALAAAKVQGAQSQNALVGAQAQQAQRTMGIQNELDNFDGSDPSKLSRPAQKQFASEQSAQKMAALDQHMKVIEAGTQLAQGATDQASWDAFRQEMAGYDLKAAQNIPAQFDPATRDAFVVKGLSVKDSFANQMKMLEMQSKDADRQEMMNYRRDMLDVARMKAEKPAGSNKPIFIDTPNGKMKWNYETETFEPVYGSDGKPVTKAPTFQQQKAEASASAGRQKTVDAADNIIKTLTELKNHPGKDASLGLSSLSNRFAVPGGKSADFLALSDKVKGQLFLQAFESLKGGGAITEVEGKKGTDSLASLDYKQSPEQFDKQIDDAIAVAQKAKDRALGGFNVNQNGTDNSAQGGVLHVDSAGNKALVFPDGSYQEVQ